MKDQNTRSEIQNYLDQLFILEKTIERKIMIIEKSFKKDLKKYRLNQGKNLHRLLLALINLNRLIINNKIKESSEIRHQANIWEYGLSKYYLRIIFEFSHGRILLLRCFPIGKHREYEKYLNRK